MSNHKKIKPTSFLLGAMLVMATIAPVLAQDAGFLKDYSQLETRKDAKGVERKIWINPKLTPQSYQVLAVMARPWQPRRQRQGITSVADASPGRDLGVAGVVREHLQHKRKLASSRSHSNPLRAAS